MKTFQIVIEGTVPGDSAKDVLEAAASLRILAGKFAENLAGGGNVRRAGLAIENAPGHHAADSQYYDLLAAPAPEADGAGESPAPEVEKAPETAATGDVTTVAEASAAPAEALAGDTATTS